MSFTKFNQFTQVNTINTNNDFVVGYRNNDTTEYEVRFPISLFNTSGSIGNLSNLTTTDKSSIVNAINEVNANKITKADLSSISPLSYNYSTGVFSISQATSTTNGYIVAADWNTFNNKQAHITLTTTNNSGSATFSNNTLNIPTYTAVGLGALTNITGLLSAGSNISISGSGTSVNPYIISSSGNYALPIASQSILGGIKVGNNLAIDVTGVLNNTYTYTLPIASASTLGGIKVGTNLSITDGILSSNNQSITFTGSGDISGTASGTTTLSATFSVDKIKGTMLGTLSGATNGQVLTWNGSAWAPANTVSALQTVVQLNTEADTYNLVLSDGGTVIESVNSNNLSIIIPNNTTVAFPIGTEISILRHNSATIAFQADSGVTIHSRNSLLSIGHQYAGVSLLKTATNDWYLIGDLA